MGLVHLEKADIGQFREFLTLEGHKNESFPFHPRNVTAAAVAQQFNEYVEQNRRIGAVFITENGQRNQRLLGMITAWDIAGAQPR